jgi:hypothetical protein
MVRLPGAALHYEARHIDLRISAHDIFTPFPCPTADNPSGGVHERAGLTRLYSFVRESHSAGPSRITIFVLFTGVGKTLDALWSAGRLTRGPDAHIEIIAPEIVPYLPATRHRRLC